MPKTLQEYTSPTHKVVGFLKAGRDKLREKYRAQTEKLRVAENQIRAVNKSREAWRERAELAERELKDLKKSLN